MPTSIFVTPDQAQWVKDWKEYAWNISMLDAGGRELDCYLSDAPFRAVLMRARKFLGKNYAYSRVVETRRKIYLMFKPEEYHEPIVTEVRIFGSPDGVPDLYAGQFLRNWPTWSPGQHFLIA